MLPGSTGVLRVACHWVRCRPPASTTQMDFRYLRLFVWLHPSRSFSSAQAAQFCVVQTEPWWRMQDRPGEMSA